MAFEDIRGTMGKSVVVTRSRAGLVTRRKPTFKLQPTPAMQVAIERMNAASAIWNELSHAEALLWGEFARGVKLVEKVSMRSYSPQPRNAFMGLTTKFMQVNPGAEVPRVPPATPFQGDSVLLQVSTSRAPSPSPPQDRTQPG
jgi:hypothetical protein